MGSSYEYGFYTRQQKAALEAVEVLRKNTAAIETSTALAVTESFRSVQHCLDRVPMTRAQRAEIDLHMQNLSLVLEKQT